jgi:hypothetical protein
VFEVQVHHGKWPDFVKSPLAGGTPAIMLV